MTKHNKMGNKEVQSYQIGDDNYVIIGCWDKGTPIGEYEFFDVYKAEGNELICINEGEPFWELPTKEEIEEFDNN